MLLFQLVREEARRFPVLEPDSGWTEDDVWDCTQDFFAAQGSRVTAAVLTQTADVDSMGRYLRRSIRNFLVSEARKTPTGAVRRKIEDLLAVSPMFERVPTGAPGAGRWQLASAQWPPYAGELRPLVAAAYSVAGVRTVRWSGERRAPLASDDSLIAILTAVLSAAAGSLEIAELTWVLLQRFPAAVEPADATLDQSTFELAIAPLQDRPDVLVEIGARAQEVYEQLSPSQRALLPHIARPVADQMQVLDVRRSQAYEAARKLKAVLEELVPEDDLRGDVTLEVVRLCVVNP